MEKEHLYKHIIWVDDFDNQNISLSDIPSDENEWDLEEKDIEKSNHEKDINAIFGEKYANQVMLIMDIPKMLEYVDNNLYKCDCVVLDVNLNKALGNNQIIKKIKDKCKNKNIVTEDDIKSCGGYYIYLYLLQSGFPTSNICMFTGNKGDNNSTGRWENKFLVAGIKPPISIARTMSEELQNWIDKLFENEYYKTRLLVYKACEYWKGTLINEKSADIEFNKVYYNKNSDYFIEANNFIDMLERVERLFPIIEPSNCKMIYYQVLQVLTMYHEESAKINVLDDEKYSHIRRYHQAVRNFRNWSAHNQFVCNEIDASLFTYLFCMTLRTYFKVAENQFDTTYNNENIEIYDEYEKEYFETIIGKSFDFSALSKGYMDAFNRHFDKVKNFGKKKYNCWDCKDMTSLLLSSGNCRNSDNDKMQFSDILLNIIDHLIIQENEKNDIGYPTEDVYKFEFKVTYKWAEEYKFINFDEIKKSDPFKAVAYILYLQNI